MQHSGRNLSSTCGICHSKKMLGQHHCQRPVNKACMHGNHHHPQVRPLLAHPMVGPGWYAPELKSAFCNVQTTKQPSVVFHASVLYSDHQTTFETCYKKDHTRSNITCHARRTLHHLGHNTTIA
eukprot:683760-Amphidinium_carterae.1